MPAFGEPATKNYRLPSLWGELADHTPQSWRSQRSPELVGLFAAQVYGTTPAGGGVAGVAETSRDETALDGAATRRELTVTLSGPLGTRDVHLLLYTPNDRSTPAPVLFGLNFQGNHSTTFEPAVTISRSWIPEPVGRGAQARRWPYARAITRGYAVATVHYADIEEDRPGHAATGVRGLFDTAEQLEHERQPDGWGAIGAWAWGMSRIIDVLLTMPELDASRIVAHGHSRLGKTALWAGAQDQRIAAAISNDSGCAGASLFRHHSGESVHMITRDFPHWFCPRFNDYAGAHESLPVDQHLLLAAILPRPVHVASADLDAHADPYGEFLATVHASPIAGLFGGRGTAHPAPAADVPTETALAITPPTAGSRVGGLLSYSLRAGEHDVLAEDWDHFMDFADENLG